MSMQLCTNTEIDEILGLLDNDVGTKQEVMGTNHGDNASKGKCERQDYTSAQEIACMQLG